MANFSVTRRIPAGGDLENAWIAAVLTGTSVLRVCGFLAYQPNEKQTKAIQQATPMKTQYKEVTQQATPMKTNCHQFKYLLAGACAVIGLLVGNAASAHSLERIGNVFYIYMENHNWTQPNGNVDPNSGTIEQIKGNPAAPFINSLIDPNSPMSEPLANALTSCRGRDRSTCASLSSGGYRILESHFH